MISASISAERADFVARSNFANVSKNWSCPFFLASFQFRIDHASMSWPYSVGFCSAVAARTRCPDASSHGGATSVSVGTLMQRLSSAAQRMYVSA
jgi:hypothetical protein